MSPADNGRSKKFPISNSKPCTTKNFFIQNISKDFFNYRLVLKSFSFTIFVLNRLSVKVSCSECERSFFDNFFYSDADLQSWLMITNIVFQWQIYWFVDYRDIEIISCIRRFPSKWPCTLKVYGSTPGPLSKEVRLGIYRGSFLNNGRFYFSCKNFFTDDFFQ